MGARDLLAELMAAGITLTVEGDKLIARPGSRLTDAIRNDLRQHKPALVALLAEPARPYRLSPAEADTAHADPWDDAAIARFTARVQRIRALGFDPPDADDLAERLHLRDVHADHRHLCLECRHLAGRLGTGWRCRNALASQVGRDLPHELVTQAQRCPGFDD